MVRNVLRQIWPEWEIDEKPLGTDAGVTVYKAVNKTPDGVRYSAIKVISVPVYPSAVENLRVEGYNDDDIRQYFQNIVNDIVYEIRLMESLYDTQNIVCVEDYNVIERTGELGWDIFIRMELLTPVDKYFGSRRLSESEVVRLGYDICSALEAVADRNMIHRGIKPQNIFASDHGHFKLGDFVCSRVLGEMKIGAPQLGVNDYMAPEVYHGGRFDARADIYSLGMVLYKLLNYNFYPFIGSAEQMRNGDLRQQAVVRRLNGEQLPAPAMASAAMAQVILRACDPDPAKRYQSASEMKRALNALLNSTPSENVPRIYSLKDYNAAMSTGKNEPAPEPAVQKPAHTPNEKKKKRTGKLFGVIGGAAAAAVALVLVCAVGLFAIWEIFIGNKATIVDSGTCGNSITWSLDSNGALSVEGVGDMPTYNDTERAPWDSYADDIKKVSLGEGITSVGSYSFAGCKKLTNVNLPASLKTVGGYAFKWCGVTEITFPDSVETIGTGAFYQNGELSEVKFSASLMYIHDYAFFECKSIEAVILPDSVRYIGAESFAGCLSIRKIELGNGVRQICDYAFKWTGTKEIEIPDSTVHLGVGVFYDCGSLTTVSIGNSVDTVGAYAFFSCDSIRVVVLGSKVENIGPGAFEDCTSISDIVYYGKTEQWSNIVVGNGNDAFIEENITFVLDG